jgi:hypothetical protein
MNINPSPKPHFRTLFHYTLWIVSAVLLWAANTASAQHLIGLKIGLTGNGHQQGTNLAAGALQPGDLAGAPGYQQMNWNVLGRFGDNGTNTFLTNNYPMFDSGGDDTQVSIMWDATGNWSIQGSGTPAAQGSPDLNLMNAYADSGASANVALTQNASVYSQNGNNKPLVFIGGLQAWLTTEGASYYDVVIYGDGDSTQGRTWEYWLQAAAQGATTGPITNLTFGSDLTTHAFICDRANFLATSTYAQSPLVSACNWIPTVAGFGGGNAGWGANIGNNPGNYVVLPGLTNDSFVVRTEEFRGAGSTLRSPINAIQIVPHIAPTPPTVGPLADVKAFAGGKAVFRGLVGGALPITYQWQKNGSPLSDGGNVSGSTTSVLTLGNIGAGDVANYTLIATGPGGTTSASAALSLVPYDPNSFPEHVVTNNPYAYWRLNDSGDPSTNNSVAHDYTGAFNGMYGINAQNGLNGNAGPSSGYPGFEAGNTCLRSGNGVINSWVIAPPLQLFTNSVTLCAWVNPATIGPANSAILFTRTTNSDVSGFALGANNNLSYTWNGASATFNFVSGLVVPTNLWSFVGVIVSPTNAILFVYNANGLLSATNVLAHGNAPWTGLTCIGNDPSASIGNTPANRTFPGLLDEVAVFNRSVTLFEIYNLYKKSLHQGQFPPAISSQPQPSVIYAGRTARFGVQASGDPFLALNYQWRKNGSNLSNGGNVSGATTSALGLSSVSAADTANYDVVVANLVGSITSSPAPLTVVASNSTPVAYEASLMQLNPAHYWRMNETNGSPYAFDYWSGNVATNINVVTALNGPESPDFAGLETTNAAYQYTFDPVTLENSSFTDTLQPFMNNLGQFSIVGWFNSPGSQPVRTGLFGQNDVTEFGFHGADASGLALVGLWTPSAAAYIGQTNITANQWYMAAGIGSGSSVTLYLFTTNGGGGAQILQASSAGTTTNYGNSAYSFKIGGGGVLDPTGNFFTGLIDEVAIWNRALSAGELANLFGSSIGVAGLPPQITAQPTPPTNTLYSGRTVLYSVTAVGSAPLTYTWRKGGVVLSDAAGISGSATASLSISNVGAANNGDYDVVIANSFGSVTSSIVSLGVITPNPNGYEAAVVGLSPLAYYRLNETNGTTAFDFVGGNAGQYASSATMGVPGPESPAFYGFEGSNTGVGITAHVGNSYVTAPFGSLSTNTVTMSMWINPAGIAGTDFDPYAGLLVNRNAGVAGGFGYTGGQIGYTWNNNNANTYNFRSGFVPPTNQWSFVGMVVTPSNAVIYAGTPPGPLQSATNVLTHTSDVLGNNWQIGNDNNDNLNSGSRGFLGSIDEVAVFTKSLSFPQMQQLYSVGLNGAPVTLNIHSSGANVVLTWSTGTLQAAGDVNGPYVDVASASSPYTISPSGTQQFFRVRVH